MRNVTYVTVTSRRRCVACRSKECLRCQSAGVHSWRHADSPDKTSRDYCDTVRLSWYYVCNSLHDALSAGGPLSLDANSETSLITCSSSCNNCLTVFLIIIIIIVIIINVDVIMSYII